MFTTANVSVAVEVLSPQKNILIIYSFNDTNHWDHAIRLGLMEVLHDTIPLINLFDENLDAARFPTEAHREKFRRYISEKYADIRLDAIVSMSEPASLFLMTLDKDFLSVPLLMIDPSVMFREDFQCEEHTHIFSYGSNVYGAVRDVLERFQPRTLYIVGETLSQSGAERVAQLQRAELSKVKNGNLHFLLNLEVDELVEAIHRISAEDAIFYLPLTHTPSGRDLDPYRVAQRIAGIAQAPTFSHWDSLLGSGIIGGYMLSSKHVGRIAAQGIMELATGQSDTILANPDGIFVRAYDARVLERFGLTAEHLPADAEIRFYTIPQWKEHLGLLVSGAVLFVGLTVMLVITGRSLTKVSASRNALHDTQQKLEQSHAVLERRVAERTERLQLARREAVAANKAKSEFLANMSHELRTPMNAIIGLSQLALQTGLNEKQKNYIQKVHLAATSLLGILNDILDFSKIEAGKLEIENVPFRLEEVFDSLTNIITLKAQEKGIELLFDLPSTLPVSLIGDPMRLRQILVNLSMNAIKFTDHGEVVIGVAVEEEEAAYVRLRFIVRDTGVGISKEQQAKLFQSFIQGDNSTTRRFGGTGLGLVISLKLTKMMQGDIWLESDEGRGSTFSFTAVFEKQKLGSVETPSLAQEIGSLSILVVEDNATSMDILTNLLTGFGFRVDQAPNGATALILVQERADTSKYDLILLDADLHDIGGNEVVRALASNIALHEKTKYILMMPSGCAETMLAFDNVAISACLHKPFTPSSLLEAIMIAMGKAELITRYVESEYESMQSAVEKLIGARILLVEDNELNRALAIDVLGNNGIAVVVANHGREALDILAEDADFDGILMDCQMPIMDGYAATQAIRQQLRFAELPIIAMTANVMAGDQEKTLAAGMNDHIGKPLNLRDMFTKMARWIVPAPHRQVITPIHHTTVPANDSAALDNLPGVDVRQGLRTTQNNMALYQKLLQVFKRNQSDFIDQFRNAIDQEEATRLAHTLRGAAGNIGALPLYTAAGELEKAAARGNSTQIATALDSVMEHLDPLLCAIQSQETATINGDLTTHSITRSTAQLIEHLQILAGKLANDDIEAMNLFEQLGNASVVFADIQEEINALAESIQACDFETAYAQTMTIIEYFTSSDQH
ncbi:response regulator [Chrysiogenes arsenatis]|uniref:response regulator n=1 Tax=Chrysiogenes arsenatis TaxID=309797 RepID=UPI00135F1B47|nr:response regulator [Chrysiogenes arsenatis]